MSVLTAQSVAGPRWCKKGEVMRTERERFVATLGFQRSDRIPFQPGSARRSTLAAWHKQGLPLEVTDYRGYVGHLLGMELPQTQPPVDPGIDFRMIPQFEEKIIERRPGTLVVQDWKGNVCEISDQYDASYLRNAIDFVTRKWIHCPVQSRADWPDIARRYVHTQPARFPADFARRCTQLAGRDYPSVLGVPGPFWQLREWLGFEGLCVLFLDAPAFVEEMINFWQEFVSRMLKQILTQYVPDVLCISEDMAYKLKPMISPAMARRFLSPCWRAWAGQARAAGVAVVECDSDGFVGDLIPLWIEAGINSNSPQEVAAGNDLPAYRRQYGATMAYRGGVDKRAMAKGGEILRKEIARLRPSIEDGGYIPGCDHAIPPDVSWPNFVEYCRWLAQATGWL